MVSLKRSHFSTHHCVFFPTFVRILAGRLESCFPTHTKKYMTPIPALIFQKYVKMSVCIRHIKSQSRCKLVTQLGEYVQQKRLAGSSFFQNMGSQGHVSSRQKFEGSALEPFFHFFFRLNGL